MHKFFPLRYRYIFTKSGNVRFRYSFAAVLFLSFFAVSLVQHYVGVFGAVTWVSQDNASSHIVLSDRHKAELPSDAGVAVQMQSRVSETMRMASQLIKKSTKPLEQSLKIGAGQTVAGVLQEAGVSGADAFQIVKKLGKYYDPRNVKPGQIIDIKFSKAKTRGGEPEFLKLSMKLSPIKQVEITRNDQIFDAQIIEQELQEKTYARYADIQTSIYGSAARAGIPSSIIAKAIRTYSWGVDFQRDIRRGDRIEVLYKAYETESGDFAKYGDLLYANLTVGGKDIPIYRYKMSDGRVDYFKPNGRGIKKTLMRTPIDGARISSRYGMRRHPVLGYNKMHKGMDFAASTGTPVYAAGDGILKHVGRKGSYGNYVRIRHNSSLDTAYAHLHRFAKGMRSGKRVKQGQVIGYVGTTGRSTGAHLHYEVFLNSKQVNPNRVDLPTGERLSGKNLKKFKAYVSSVKREYAELTQNLKFAKLAKR